MKWPLVPLGDVADFDRKGVTPEAIRSGTLYVGLENILEGGELLNVGSVNNGELASSKFAFTGSHILYGKLRPYLCKIARPAFDGICSTDIVPLLPSAKIDRNYLIHFLRLGSSVSFASERAVGVNLPRISPSVLATLPIPVPELQEQRRIAAILDQAEALRDKRRQALAKLDTLTQSLFLEMFGDPRSNPKGWMIGSLGALAEVTGGLQITPKRKHERLQVPYLRVANVYRDHIHLSEVKTLGLSTGEFTRTKLRNGDLLVVEGHGNPQEIGRCAVWSGQIADCVHQNHLIRVRFNKEKVVPEFASIYLNSRVGREQVLRLGKTTSGLNTLSTSDVKTFRLYVPPRYLQDKFLSAVSKIKKSRSLAEDHLQSSENLMLSLQHKAFRGEL